VNHGSSWLTFGFSDCISIVSLQLFVFNTTQSAGTATSRKATTNFTENRGPHRSTKLLRKGQHSSNASPNYSQSLITKIGYKKPQFARLFSREI
jgi:hypothetical protein